MYSPVQKPDGFCVFENVCVQFGPKNLVRFLTQGLYIFLSNNEEYRILLENLKNKFLNKKVFKIITMIFRTTKRLGGYTCSCLQLARR